MMDRVIIFRNIEGIKIENLILSKRTNKEPCDLIHSVDVRSQHSWLTKKNSSNTVHTECDIFQPWS